MAAVPRAPRTFLEQLIRAREATYEETSKQINDLARKIGEKRAGMSLRHLQRLAHGERREQQPTPPTRRVLREFFGFPIEELLGPPRTHLDLASSVSPRPRGEWLPITGSSTKGVEPLEVLMSAASESSADALLRSTDIGADALPELVQRVMSVAGAYNSASRMAAFKYARDTRDLALKLADRTCRPTELADLYVTAGESNALMASLAFDLGSWNSSETMARAASLYADLAGHASLRAWTLGLEATLAFWRGDANRALDRIEAGLAIAPAGAPRVRLFYIASRAHAVRGDAAGAAHVLMAAEADREIAVGSRDELNDVVGGEFRFDDSRAAACAGATWLKLGNGIEAIRYTRQTLELHERRGNTVSTGILSGARIDSATAQLLQGELDEARSYLEPVLALDKDAGNISLGARLAHTRRLLTGPRWEKDPAAVALSQQVDDWLRSSDVPAGGGQ